MKGKIDEGGYLMLSRKVTIPAYCPFADVEIVPGTWGNKQCGDWCALFGEPEAETKPVTTCTVNDEESCDDDTPMNTLKYAVGLGDDAYKHTLNYRFRINDTLTGCTLLRLCHGTVLTFDEFEDERSAE